MAGFVLIGLFAAFGILCGIWTVFGWLLPGSAGGAVICRGSPGFPERHFVRRYLFLVETGLLRCGLLVLDQGLTEAERGWLRRFDGRVEICTPEEFSSRLELERKQRD